MSTRGKRKSSSHHEEGPSSKSRRSLGRRSDIGTDGIDDKTLESTASKWFNHLKKKGWKTFVPRNEDYGFYPPEFKDVSIKDLKKQGKRGQHYAEGWHGLYDFVKAHGKLDSNENIVSMTIPPLPKSSDVAKDVKLAVSEAEAAMDTDVGEEAGGNNSQVSKNVKKAISDAENVTPASPRKRSGKAASRVALNGKSTKQPAKAAGKAQAEHMMEVVKSMPWSDAGYQHLTTLFDQWKGEQKAS